jgi:hypothetical protein
MMDLHNIDKGMITKEGNLKGFTGWFLNVRVTVDRNANAMVDTAPNPKTDTHIVMLDFNEIIKVSPALAAEPTSVFVHDVDWESLNADVNELTQQTQDMAKRVAKMGSKLQKP